MTKKEVIERLCRLTNVVAKKKFNHLKAADCFCGTNPTSDMSHYQFEHEIMNFIENAVHEKLEE